MIARNHLITVVAILMESSDHYRTLWRGQRGEQDPTLRRVYARMHWRARTAEAEVQAELAALDADPYELPGDAWDPDDRVHLTRKGKTLLERGRRRTFPGRKGAGS